MRTPCTSRARACVAAFVLATFGGALLLSAPPAAAAEPPVRSEEAPAPAFRAVLEAIDRLLGRSGRAEPYERAEQPEAPATPGRGGQAEAEPARQAAESCVEAGDSNDVPRVVADIFRCRLAEAGVADADARRIAAEAVVVSHCESRWDPDVVVFDGRYLDTPHPRTGNRYSAAGVFQFIRATADKWIDGGYAQVRNPRRNIDAAARLFIENRSRGLGGWGDWACAAVNDGFKSGSVLPGWPGGPAELPEWATRYVV